MQWIICFRLKSELFHYIWKNVICISKPTAIIETVYWTWGFPRQLWSFSVWNFPLRPYPSPGLSSFPSVCSTFVSMGCRTHAVDVNTNRKSKKSTDVIHMLVIHSTSCRTSLLPWVRRGLMAQTGFVSIQVLCSTCTHTIACYVLSLWAPHATIIC